MAEVFLVRGASGRYKAVPTQANVFSDIYKAMRYWHHNQPCSFVVKAMDIDSPNTQRNVNKKERDDALKHLGLL